MIVDLASPDDVPGWLCLAAEVEPLFGPMCNEPSFRRALERNIARGTALCIREQDGLPGSSLLAGMLYSVPPPYYRIGWLSVAEAHRHRGLGSCLLNHLLDLLPRPAELRVTTFGPDLADGRPARQFYTSFDFQPIGEPTESPEGQSRQVYRLYLTLPSSADGHSQPVVNPTSRR